MSIVRLNFKQAPHRRRAARVSMAAQRCRRKFLRFFPKGFQDLKYDAWERGYKWEAHEAWNEVLNQAEYKTLLGQRKFSEIAARAIRLESR